MAASVACKKNEPPPVSKPPVEHIAPLPVGTTQTVLDKTFSLKDSATFPFDVPAHATQPHLHGIFQSFAGKAHGPSDDTANVDFAILNEAQQSDAVADRPSEAVFSVDASHNHSINVDLPPSMNQPVKYYLVFRKSQGTKGNRVVEASFRVEF